VSAPLPLAEAAARLRRPAGRPRKAVTTETPTEILPALLDLESSAKYLGGVSVWTVRDLESAGVLRRVRIPVKPGGRDLRKILFARTDLDAAIERWKDAARDEPGNGGSA
jgi:hypothetical protein